MEKYKKEFYVNIIIGVCLIIVVLWMVCSLSSEQSEWLEKVEFAKTLDWGQPENATIEYRTYRYAQEGDWYKVKVRISFEEEPWRDYTGKLWFTMDGKTHFSLV